MGELNLSAKKGNIEARNRINLILRNYFSMFVIILMAVLAYAGYFALIVPKKEQINIEREKIREKRETDKRALEANLEALRNYRRAFENLSSAEKERLDIFLPPAGKEDNLFTNLEALVLRQGFVPKSIDIGANQKEKAKAKPDPSGPPQAEKESFKTIAVKLEIGGVGTYARFKEFLSVLENNLRLCDVQSFQYSETDGLLTIDMNVYSLQ